MRKRNGALVAADARWAKTACILCECNCGLEVQVADRRLTRIRGDKAHPASAGYTCEKALRLDHYQNGRHRLTSPLRRRPDGTYEEIDWDTAVSEIAAKLAAVRDTHGGDKIFFYGGGGQGNHLGGVYGRALQAALGVRYFSNALAQEKTGEMWVDGKLYGGHTKGDFEALRAAAVWGLAQICATTYPDAVRRAGFNDGNALFDAILATPSGIAFTVDNWDDVWAYVRRPDRRLTIEIPELIEKLHHLRAAEPGHTSDEFPLVLSAGERRSFTANTIYRDPPGAAATLPAPCASAHTTPTRSD
jgi:Molybdopterin oxidoreductase Fe4S4 domain/Molybdopterin oxidoreductase